MCQPGSGCIWNFHGIRKLTNNDLPELSIKSALTSIVVALIVWTEIISPIIVKIQLNQCAYNKSPFD